jgi:hypothetical protein
MSLRSCNFAKDSVGLKLVRAWTALDPSPQSFLSPSLRPDMGSPPTSSPDASDPVECRVSSSNTLDDVDYDIVRYRYVWKVNGGTVRDVVTAARSNMIARDTALLNSTLQCTVTPNDGVLDGPSASISVHVPGACPLDTNHDGSVGPADLAQLLATWGQCP